MTQKEGAMVQRHKVLILTPLWWDEQFTINSTVEGQFQELTNSRKQQQHWPVIR